jgi:hypothetical protein
MASVDRNVLNPVEKTTDIHANTAGNTLYKGEFTFVIDAHPAFASTAPIGGQQIDAAYGRAINTGRGVVGEGGDAGPGVVGIAGKVVPTPAPSFPRPLKDGPQLGRGMRAGVIGFGSDPAMHGERAASDAVGVFGFADKSVGVAGMSSKLPGVLGFAREHAGVFGSSGTVGVLGWGRDAHIGVEGAGGAFAGVYGHVDYANPAPSMVGVWGSAALTLGGGPPVGRAGVFTGPVDVHGDLTVLDNFVVWGTKSAAARHRDGTHRLMYCVESPESLFEDVGEAELRDGVADVALDPDFAAISNLGRYQVFVTPYGQCNGLFVARRTRSGFRVRELARGRASIAFGWRVVALRRGVATERFAHVERPPAPKPPRPLGAPSVDVAPLLKPARRHRR